MSWEERVGGSPQAGREPSPVLRGLACRDRGHGRGRHRSPRAWICFRISAPPHANFDITSSDPAKPPRESRAMSDFAGDANGLFLFF